ncbi:MAG: peptidyl-alpha-hydroxyglycine alpha-amidating lyase family protein [Bacteroidetes bacterium]|nr:peptidyl-alpha-hydroxyglycine alpha-amidating lyase family protein [Bacteroidota bacterium]MCL5025593.1 peptidyl-alpha-hydroxyglycine alpha-amidating lyase family protein [Chloroflexota bacterium]
MLYGSGKFTYARVDEWAKLPARMEFGQVTGAAVDSRDRVYVFNRSEHPVIVFERDGSFIKTWGEGVFGRAHGIFIGPDDSVYCTDDQDHVVMRFTTDGQVTMTLGTKGVPGDSGYIPGPDLLKQLDTITHGGPPFNRPTKLVLDASGDMFITDGYGNARVHHFSAEGKLIKSFGEPGSGPGQFRLPHGLWADRTGRVLVADRENSRVQIFTSDGAFITEWPNLMRPADVFVDPDDNIYVAEIDGRISIRDLAGNLLAQFGGDDAEARSHVQTAHSIWVDRHGDLYIGRLGAGPRIEKFVRQA